MLAIAGLLILILAVTILIFGTGASGAERAARRRLRAIDKPTVAAQMGQSTLRFQEVAESAFVELLTTPTAIAKLQRNLVLAGSPEDWPLSKVMTYKVIGTVLGAGLAVMQLSQGLTLMHIAMAVLGLAVGYFGPDAIAARLARTRQESIQKELPDVLDQVSISLAAGLGFEGALATIGERRTGPMADEIVRTVQDIRLGVTRREAYEAMALRNDVPDLTRFVRALAQADKHGVSISTVVTTQADEMRFNRKKRAEAQANKVPVKIIFPLMLCILPVLFAIILTPAFMSIGDTL